MNNRGFCYCSGQTDNKESKKCPIRENCKRFTTDRYTMVDNPFMSFCSYNFSTDDCRYFCKKDFQNYEELFDIENCNFDITDSNDIDFFDDQDNDFSQLKLLRKIII